MKSFQRLRLPDGRTKLVPDDIRLRFPLREGNPSLAIKLVEIPWDEAYGQRIPSEFLDFWDRAFRYLHVRTTDVHVAICLMLMDELFSLFPSDSYDRRVVGIGIIFHDAGWTKLSDDQVAASLGVTGLVLTLGAIGPKEAHLEEGRKIVEEELKNFPELTHAQCQTIIEIVAFHDFPDRSTDTSLSFKIACDLDHLWSFTHENFWQDTVRKDVDPHEYWNNLEKDLDGYFVTEQGKKFARRLLGERKDELSLYDKTQQGRV